MATFKLETRSDEELLEHDFRDCITIMQDDKEVFSVSDGEPEDNNLGRNFEACYSVYDLLEYCYNLGKDGAEVTFE